jgi:hypothetical protein
MVCRNVAEVAARAVPLQAREVLDSRARLDEGKGSRYVPMLHLAELPTY